MALDFTHSIDIDRPAREVFAFVAEFENNPLWQGGMKCCAWTSSVKGIVGATYLQRAQFMGRRIDTHFVVSAIVNGESISIESTQSTFPIQVTRSVRAHGDAACIVSAHIRGQPPGVLKLFSGMVKRSVAKDYAKLKQGLESGAWASSSSP